MAESGRWIWFFACVEDWSLFVARLFLGQFPGVIAGICVLFLWRAVGRFCFVGEIFRCGRGSCFHQAVGGLPLLV